MTERLPQILLVEDDDVAAESIVRSLHKHEVRFPVVHAEDGQVALDILRHRHPERRLGRPFLILLDLNMPRMNGFEFLHELRADAGLRDSVAFVLTTSDTESDRAGAYRENVAGYMVKSAVGPQFRQLARLLIEYGAAVRLP